MVLKSRVLAPDWGANEDPEKEAKCRKHPLPSIEEGRPDDPWFGIGDTNEREAAEVCNGEWDNRVCPFRTGCLSRALVNNEQFGTFGGLLTIQRRWIRKNIPRDGWGNVDHQSVPTMEYFDEVANSANEAEAEETGQDQADGSDG